MKAKKVSERIVPYARKKHTSLAKKAHSVKKEVGSFRLDADLKKSVKGWLAQNPGINFSRLVNLAIFDYITQPHILKPVEIEIASHEEMLRSLQKMMHQHAETLEQLK